MEIIPATQKDYVELIEVWEASVRATHHFLSKRDILYFKPLILKEYFKLVDIFCVRDQSDQVIGFAGVADKKIEMLFVLPDWFGKGIGKSLLLRSIHQQKASQVDVNEQNPSAVEFYKHMGFDVVSRSETDGLGKPFPLLHMELG